MILKIGRKRQSRPAGFTLIELIIVAAIILVLVAVSTPLFRATFRDLKLKDAAYNLSKLIKYGQQRAIIEEKRYRLLFDFEKRAYYLRVENEEPQEGESSASAKGESASGGEGEAVFSWKKVTGRFGEYFYLPEGVSLKADIDKITFLPNGRCDKISIYVINQKNKTIEIKTDGRAGYVKVSEVTEK